MWGGCEVGGVFKFDIYLAILDIQHTTMHGGLRARRTRGVAWQSQIG